MGSLVDDTIADLLEGPVKHKGGKSNRNRARRLTNGAPEVMVKISGNTKSAEHVQSHLDYISRNGKIEIEDENGDVLMGKSAVRSLSKEWTTTSKKPNARGRKSTRETTNIVLSMPNGTDPGQVKAAARAFAKHQFSHNYRYVMALHTDTDSPHVHLTVRNLGRDGRRLNVKNGDPQKWRETFATELERCGVEAEATPRATRGVIKKGVNQAVRHMREKGMTPEVDQAKVREVIEDFRNEQAGQPPKARPWEDRIKNRQTHVRKAWMTAAQGLNESRDPEDRDLAKSITTFVRSMPPMKTERHELQETIAGQLQKRQEMQRDNEKGKGPEQEDER